MLDPGKSHETTRTRIGIPGLLVLLREWFSNHEKNSALQTSRTWE